jgi:hypothetical protein
MQISITYSLQIGVQPRAQFLQGDFVFVHIQFTFQVVQFVLALLLLITGRRCRIGRPARLNSMDRTLLSAKTRQI